MTDEEFHKQTAEAVRTAAFIALAVLGALLAMFLWGVGHRALEEYDHWSCARTCTPFGVESVGGYSGCECQKPDAKKQVEDYVRLETAKRLIDDLLDKERKGRLQ